MIVIQDTYFYWTHRLMHHRRLFRWFHRTHHRSTNPNPWTTYSIGPLEAIVDSGASVLILMLIPTTGLALFIVQLDQYGVRGVRPPRLRTVAGGHRQSLARPLDQYLGGAQRPTTRKARYNYGWYFLFWDRMMGTLDPSYADSFRQRVTVHY